MALVVNTRPADQSQELTDLLQRAGFETTEIPLVEIMPDEEGLARLRRLPTTGFTGVFLSSPNGLRHMEAGLLPIELEAWMEKPFYLVGGKSASLVENLGGRVAFYPQKASLEGFLEEYSPTEAMHALGARNLSVTGLVLAQRWMHPCSASTRLEPTAFKAKGIGVENVVVYRPGMPPQAAAALGAQATSVDAVVFCSGSAVTNFFQAAPELGARLGRKDGILAVSIGPSTSKILIEKGVENYREAVHADNSSLVDALKQAFGGQATKVFTKQPEKKP